MTSFWLIWGGTPQIWKYLLKIMYSYMFKLQSPSKYFPFNAIYPLRLFSHCSTVLNASMLMPLVLLWFFVLPLPHGQNFSLWGLFSSRETKKVAWGENRWIGRVGHGDHAVFGQKLLNTQLGVGRSTHKSPIMKWANALSLQREFAEAKHSLSQQCRQVHWYRWVPRTLT